MRRGGRPSWARLAAAGLLLATALAGCGDEPRPGSEEPPLPPYEPLALSRLSVARDVSGRPRIVDAKGREVLLRGPNVNGWGDYHQGDPEAIPTEPLSESDWDAVAREGFSVVRLIVSWSKLEPERGELDEGYVRELRGAVEAAGKRGIYTVLDMHQDAFSKHVATPEGTTCKEGTEPAIGWDGAPEWATITDGADTCRPKGYREGAPAVQAAFRNFYENTDGIRDRYVATVAALAGEFAADERVAGIDLFNEPNKVLPDAESEQRYTELVTDLVREIREAEEAAEDGFHHLLFLEPIVLFPLPGTMPAADTPDDDDIVFAPHNYAEVITNILTVEQTFDAAWNTARDRGWPLWVGEYGVFSPSDEDMDTLTRFAAREDELMTGSAAWQWVQHCGDPHTVGTPGNHAEGEHFHLRITTCPEDTSVPNRPFLRVIGRAYPRAAPGRLTELTSDPETGELLVRGETMGRPKGELVVWVPRLEQGEDEPTIERKGLDLPFVDPQEGGWLVLADTRGGPYELHITR